LDGGLPVFTIRKLFRYTGGFEERHVVVEVVPTTEDGESSDQKRAPPDGGAAIFQTVENAGEQNGNDEEHLPNRLMFSPRSGGEDDAFVGGEQAQAGDHKFTCEDQGDHPGGHEVNGGVDGFFRGDHGGELVDARVGPIKAAAVSTLSASGSMSLPKSVQP